MQNGRTVGAFPKRLAGFAVTLSSLACAAAPLGLAALMSPLVTACADENDPKTWVAKLDDPSQRPAAVKRLSAFFEDTMNKANKNREDAAVKSLLDAAVDPLTKTYVSVPLDEKTRKDLMKLLADMRDPRTAPALAKAYNEYEPGKNDEDVKFASQAVIGLANSGKLTDQSVIDALWSCFAKFRVSQAKSINLVQDLHNAVIAVKHPSYGPKAVEKLAAPVDLTNKDQVTDQLEFWQQTAIQIILELKFVPGARALVVLILTPSKAGLRNAANAALMRMPQAAEPLLISALKGTDPEFTKLAALFEDKGAVAVVGDSVSWLSRPAGKAAILEALSNADTDTNRTVLAQSLVHFSPDASVVKAFLDAYAKLLPNAGLTMAGQTSNARGALAGASGLLFQGNLTDWLVKEIVTAKGDSADELQLHALESAIKLMQPSQMSKVEDAVNKFGAPREKGLYKVAAGVVNKCHEDTKCYLAVIDQPINPDVDTAAEGPVKAAWMAVEYAGSNAATVRAALLDKVDGIKAPGLRLVVAESIVALAPAGDPAAADKLDKIVAADAAKGERNRANDSVVKVANQLRARALP
jgi:hypothetical protein